MAARKPGVAFHQRLNPSFEPQAGPADGDDRPHGDLRRLRLDSGTGLAGDDEVSVIAAGQKQLDLRGPPRERPGFRVRLRAHPPDGPVQFSAKVHNRGFGCNYFAFVVLEQVLSIAKDLDPPFSWEAALLHRQRVRVSIAIADDLILIEAGAVEEVVFAIEDKSAAAVNCSVIWPLGAAVKVTVGDM